MKQDATPRDVRLTCPLLGCLTTVLVVVAVWLVLHNLHLIDAVFTAWLRAHS